MLIALETSLHNDPNLLEEARFAAMRAEVVEILMEFGHEQERDLASKMRGCSNTLFACVRAIGPKPDVFVRCDTRCGIRGCPICARVYSRRCAGKFCGILSMAQKANPKHSWMLYTLTLPTVTITDFDDAFKLLGTSHAKLLKHPDWPGDGSVACFEAPIGRPSLDDELQAQIHLHAAALVPRASIFGRSKLTPKRLSALWSEIVGIGKPLQVNMSYIATPDADANVVEVVRRAVRYGTKGPYCQGIAPQEYANENEAPVSVPLADPDALLAYFRLMPRRQLIRKTDRLRGVEVPKSCWALTGASKTYKLIWHRKSQEFMHSNEMSAAIVPIAA